MYIVVLSDIELGPIESLRMGTTLSGAPTGAPSIPAALTSTPSSILLQDGDRIEFGLGTEGSRLGVGPLPLLCNLRLAVARVLKMSGASDIIAQLMEDADVSDFPHNFLASENFCDILDAKLLLKGICVHIMKLIELNSIGRRCARHASF
jgi:hypothetical protein